MDAIKRLADGWSNLSAETHEFADFAWLHNTGELASDLKPLLLLKERVDRDWKFCLRHLDKHSGVDDRQKPEAGRPHTGIVQACRDVIWGLIGSIEQTKRGKTALDAARLALKEGLH